MMSSAPGPRLPPGSEGLPLVGETLSFAKNPFGFIDDRLAIHGRVFRSRILGRKTVVLAGADAAGLFIDAGVVMREGSMPPHVQELFGGRSLPLLDGEAHAARKRAVLQGFSREALAAYLPLIQGSVERYLRSWSEEGEIRWLDEMKRLSIEVICAAVIGMPPGEEMDRLRRDYGVVTGAFAALPIRAPGTRYWKALRARDRILATLLDRIREKRRTPGVEGLSRILAADASLTDEQAALELHHIVIAGFIVYAELGELARRLTENPGVRERLAEEIRAACPSGELKPDRLARMPYLLQVVNEVKRLCPIVPAVFGKARKAFDFDGVSVPAGWMVMWALRPSHVAHGVFTDPEKFDPDRFSPERAEDKRHEHAFVPQGAGPASGHRCPGLDFATVFMEVFAVALLRDYSWQLPEQSFETDFRKTPPEPRDGLRATVRRGDSRRK
jgi:retinoid hydroxylase